MIGAWSVWVAEQAQADSVFDLVARLIDNGAALIAAAVTGVTAIVIARKGGVRHEETAKQVEEQAKTIEEIRESTVNSHQRPMRYDLDDVSDAVGEVKALVETIGAEVREDRVARRAGDQALAGRLDELAVRLDRQDAIAAKHHPEDS